METLERRVSISFWYLLLLLVWLEASSGTDQFTPPGRLLFLRGAEPPLAGALKGAFYSWWGIGNGAIISFLHSRNSPTPNDSFLALFYWLDATEFRGRRIKLSATFTGLGIDDRQGAWAGLFMRVDAADRTVIAFDNMSARRYVNRAEVLGPETYAEVVLSVPALPAEDIESCPNPSLTASRIAAGFFLSGPSGEFMVRKVVVQGVGPEVAVTQPPLQFWHNPCLNNLGTGYAKPEDPLWKDKLDYDDDGFDGQFGPRL